MYNGGEKIIRLGLEAKIYRDFLAQFVQKSWWNKVSKLWTCVQFFLATVRLTVARKNWANGVSICPHIFYSVERMKKATNYIGEQRTTMMMDVPFEWSKLFFVASVRVKKLITRLRLWVWLPFSCFPSISHFFSHLLSAFTRDRASFFMYISWFFFQDEVTL